MWNDIEQNTDLWLLARSGKLTGSAAGKVMANYGKAFGEPAKKLAVDIALEQVTGKPISSDYSNSHMERGHEEEPIALILYESEYFCDVTNGGFYDNGDTGCSPDGICGDGMIEIKSAIPSIHYARIKRNSFDPAYKWQLLFNLKESGKNWIDFISFCSTFTDNKKLFVHRVNAIDYQDEFKMMESRIAEFMAEVTLIRSDIE
jgi:hypothetical protein